MPVLHEDGRCLRVNAILFWWYSTYGYGCASNGLLPPTAVTVLGKNLPFPEILTKLILSLLILTLFVLKYSKVFHQISTIIFQSLWDMAPCRFLYFTSFSENRFASIFRIIQGWLALKWEATNVCSIRNQCNNIINTDCLLQLSLLFITRIYFLWTCPVKITQTFKPQECFDICYVKLSSSYLCVCRNVFCILSLCTRIRSERHACGHNVVACLVKFS